jgi:hypothetical protein
MDARKFASKFIKPDHVRDGSITTRIISVYESEQYARPVLELETGSEFTLNDGNTNTLIKAWGHETDAWIGQELELLLGFYQDRQTGTDKETVKVRAISERLAPGTKGSSVLPPSRATTPKKNNDMDDEIPF